MKTNLVHVNKKEVFTDSVIIAEMLEVKHSTLLITLKPIIERQNKLLSNDLNSKKRFPQKFIQSTFRNKMNREYLKWELNEQAYMKLAMHLKGYEKAEIVQDSIIEAFSLMKEALLNQTNASWLKAREQGKELRALEMDIVKEFVEYATKQGSKSANLYYMNITKMTNKALEYLIQVEKGTPLRNLADITQLGYIQMLDNRAKQALEHGMNENLPYKFIYKYAKEEVNKLADSLNFKTNKIS